MQSPQLENPGINFRVDASTYQIVSLVLQLINTNENYVLMQEASNISFLKILVKEAPEKNTLGFGHYIYFTLNQELENLTQVNIQIGKVVDCISNSDDYETAYDELINFVREVRKLLLQTNELS